tara:strand:- start:1911 stop:2090 length:180 start_codon:yes stop_codon:yes gene_type:complete
MNQNFQAIVDQLKEDNSSDDQAFLFGGALLFLNLFVMLSVGLYWMNPVMHEFISGRPLL